MLKLAQIGMGGWGRSWMENIVSGFPGVRLKAIIDGDKKVLGQVQEQLGETSRDIAFLPSLEQAIREVDFDALLITCGPATHVPLAVQALQAGKHVLTEKPFGLSTQEARRAIRAAHKADRVLMVSQNYRFYPAVQTVRRLLDEKKYGPAGSACIEFRRQVPRDQQGHAITGGSYPFLLDMVIHHVDLIRYVFASDPISVVCRSWNPPWSENEHPQAISALFTMDNHMTITYAGSWVTPGLRTPWAGQWRIECSEAELNMTSRGSGLSDDHVTVIRPDHKPLAVRMRTPKNIDRAGSLGEFVRSLRDGRQPDCSGEDNIKSLAVLESMTRSIKSGRSEKVAK